MWRITWKWRIRFKFFTPALSFTHSILHSDSVFHSDSVLQLDSIVHTHSVFCSLRLHSSLWLKFVTKKLLFMHYQLDYSTFELFFPFVYHYWPLQIITTMIRIKTTTITTTMIMRIWFLTQKIFFMNYHLYYFSLWFYSSYTFYS